MCIIIRMTEEHILLLSDEKPSLLNTESYIVNLCSLDITANIFQAIIWIFAYTTTKNVILLLALVECYVSIYAAWWTQHKFHVNPYANPTVLVFSHYVGFGCACILLGLTIPYIDPFRVDYVHPMYAAFLLSSSIMFSYQKMHLEGSRDIKLYVLQQYLSTSFVSTLLVVGGLINFFDMSAVDANILVYLVYGFGYVIGVLVFFKRNAEL